MKRLIEVLSAAYGDPVAIDRIARLVAVDLGDPPPEDSTTKWQVLLERAHEANALPILWSFIFNDPPTAAFHQEIRSELAGDAELQAIVDAGLGLIHPSAVRQVNLDAERRTALIEVDGVANGTGFLVGPDLLMTAHHVVGMQWPPPSKRSVAAVFDRVASSSAPAEQGERVSVVEWIAGSPPTTAEKAGQYLQWQEPDSATHLDYAIGRLERPIGKQKVGDPARSRGFYQLHESRYRFDSVRLMTIHQHPLGMHQVMLTIPGPLQLNGLETRVRYGGVTLNGSSGSACVDPSGRLIAIHHFSTPQQNQGVPIHAIAADLRAKQRWHLFAQPSSASEPRFSIASLSDIEDWGWTLEGVLHQLVALDHELIGPTLDAVQEGEPRHWVPLFERNEAAWRLLVDRDRHIVGYWEMHPVDAKTFDAACAGRLDDGRLDHASVLFLELPGHYDVYFSMIGIAARVRGSGPLRMLFESLLTSLADLAARGVFIDRIVAAAWTDDGEALCNQFGLTRSDHDHLVGDVKVPIYVGEMRSLIERPIAAHFDRLLEPYEREAIPRSRSRRTTTPPKPRRVLRVALAESSRRLTPASFAAALDRWAADEEVVFEGHVSTLLSLQSPFIDGAARPVRIAAWLSETIRTGADLVVLDFGSHTDDAIWEPLIAQARARGCLLIAAAGDLAQPFYPAWHSGVYAVGPLGTPAPAARPANGAASKPEILAASDLENTALSALASRRRPSANAAIRTMAAALLVWATDPELSAGEVGRRLRATATALPGGHLGLDLAAALAKTRREIVNRELSQHPAGVAELARATGLTRSLLKRVLDEMAADGTIVRKGRERYERS